MFKYLFQSLSENSNETAASSCTMLLSSSESELISTISIGSLTRSGNSSFSSEVSSLKISLGGALGPELKRTFIYLEEHSKKFNFIVIFKSVER